MSSARGFDDSRAEQETFERGRQAHTQREAHFEDDLQEAGSASSGATTVPAKPSPAARPSLEQQVANLQYLGDWDDTTSALLKMVAAKLHSQGFTLCPGCDNDRFLAKLIAFDWSSEFRSMPADLRRFAWDVATELEHNPHDYQAVLGAAAGAEVTSPRPLDNEASASGMLSNMARNVVHKVVQKAIIEALPLSQEIKGAKACYERLQSIYEGNDIPQRQLEKLADALDELGVTLTARGSESGAELRTLKDYLDVVTPWLRDLSAQWKNMELSVEEMRNSESMLGKVQEMLVLIQQLLATSQLARVMPADTLSGLVQGVGAMRQTLSQVQQWQALPGDAYLDDYLGIVAANPLVKKVLDDSTLELGLVLAQVQRYAPYPSDPSLSARLAWLASTLADPALREQVQPRVAMVLGDEQANQLFAIFQLVDQLRHFPADSSMLGQARWLLSTLSQHAGDTPALAWLNQFQAALGADPATVSLMNRLLTLDQSRESRLSLMHDLTRAVAPSLGELAARQVGERLLPTAMARELEKFYQESSATESWTSLFQRLAQSVATIVKPYAAGALMNDPLAAVTVQYAEALKEHTSWEQTLRWFAAHDPSQDKTLQFVYGQYLNAMLVWQVYQAMNSSDPNETEDTLRQLARQLKDAQLVKRYPQLEKLIDLIPLLPALREAQKTVKAQPSADSWVGWCNQWVEALASSPSPSLAKLRDELSRKAESWLADGVMSAFDAAVQLPSRLLPGAAAASVPPDTRAAGGTTVPSTATSGLGANWQLGAGIGLEALGVAAIGYAIWQWRQAGRAEAAPVRDMEMQDMLAPRPPASQPQAETDAILTPEAAGAGIIASAGKPSPKLPLLMGLAGVGAMAAGGALLHRWAASDASAATQDALSDSEYQRELQIIRELQVPSLDFLFYGDQLEQDGTTRLDNETTTGPENEATTGEDEITRAVRTAGRSKRGAQFNSDSIFLEIERAKENARLQHSTTVNSIFESASRALDGSRQQYGSAARKVIYLLKSIEYFSAFIERLNNEEARQRYRPLLDGLWRIADGLADEYGQSKVAEYKQAFLINNSPREVLSGSAAMTATTTSSPTSQASLMSEIEHSGEQTLRELETLSSLIFQPAAYIDAYTKGAISRYEQKVGRTTGLTPDSRIVATKESHVYRGQRPPLSYTERYTYPLREIATGYYMHDFPQRGGGAMSKTFDNPNVPGLIEEFRSESLQSKMMGALSDYRSDSAKRAGLTSHYQKTMKLRCLDYLESPGKVPAYAQAVEYFLDGTIQAKEVSFKGNNINGVFLIPLGNWGGVLFSVDEPGFFHVGSTSLRYAGYYGESKSINVSSFPNTEAFKTWIFNKIPIYEAQKYKNQSASVFNSTLIRGRKTTVPDDNVRADRPITFGATSSEGELANKLFDGLMTRLESDIDTLVLSRSEQVTRDALEIAKSCVALASAAVTAGIPGTGSLLARFSQFMVSLSLDAAYITMGAIQAQQADRAEDAAAFRNDAIIASVLAAIGAVGVGVPLTRAGINQARSTYRQIKAASPQAIRSVLAKTNWAKLADSRKIDLLVDTIKQSDQASELTRLTGAEAVEQSIRRNLILDGLGDTKPQFAWGDFAYERAQAQRRLNSDLARLNDAKGNLGRLLDQPPAVPREAMQGVPEEAAARWIISRSKTASGAMNAAASIRNALTQYRRADLLDIRTLDSIHEAVYLPPPGQQARTFRSSSDPKFIGSDIARAGFERALNDIRLKVQAGNVDLGEALYAAINRYHPYGDGNGRTARTVYALAQLKQQDRLTFMALTRHAEDMLNPPGPLGVAAAPRVRGEQLRLIANV
ncbi:hypothetical protein WL22_23345 [Burkholderia ubonensis]|nr:hypothetical protein WL22_23345 [Burkholderia ubonensis]